jgi:hypothetical protein
VRVKLGVVACDIIKRELEPLLAELPELTEVVWLESALHCVPRAMRERIEAEVRAMGARVDAVFLGYGYCNSLKGIEASFDFPVVLPQVDDCLSLLLGPERYAEEVRKEVGTWFMSPGWAEIGVEMVIKNLHLERVRKMGKDPVEMAKRLFTHYRRALLIDTGVGDPDHMLARAEDFCRVFGLALERTRAEPVTLRSWLERARKLPGQGWSGDEDSASPHSSMRTPW